MRCVVSIHKKSTENDKEKQKKICKNMLDRTLVDEGASINTYLNAAKKESVYQCFYNLAISTEKNDTFATKEQLDKCVNK